MAKPPNGGPEKPQKNNEPSKNYQQLFPRAGAGYARPGAGASNGPPTGRVGPGYLYFMRCHLRDGQGEAEIELALRLGRCPKQINCLSRLTTETCFD